MLTFRDLITGFRKLEIDPSNPIIAHASLSAFGNVQGGAGTLLGAILATASSVIMPAFTYKTMVVPQTGPENNALDYRKRHALNRMAVFFDLELPADRLMGVLAECLRRHPKSLRSRHPILSFSGNNAQRALDAQTYAEPLAPIGVLMEEQGWVVLLGVNHTSNTSIHFAERLAGRRQFTRWALTPHGVRECPGFPGCSDGFQAIVPKLEGINRRVQIGAAQVEAVPLAPLIEIVREWIAADPLALLCSNEFCQRCSASRKTAVS